MSAAKKEARTLAHQVRAEIKANSDFGDLERLSSHLLAALSRISTRAVVAGYYPINSEIDVRPALHAIERSGYALALPRVVAAENPLVFHQWAMDDPLVKGPYQVQEPANDAPVVEPDVVLVPLLAYDREGFRLGYGGGYYDRTLDGLRRRKGIYAIGVAYEQQLVNAVPRDQYDQRLDMIVTPEGQWIPFTTS